MHTYDIGVRSSAYHGKNTLTYSSSELIPVGTIVLVPLRNASSLGVVLAKGHLPKGVRPKPITSIFSDFCLPPAQLSILQWLRQYYPAPLATIVQLFIPPAIDITHPSHNPIGESGVTPALPPLTPQQKQALQTIQASKTTTALVHGDTGTGKTRLYIDLARTYLKTKRSVIVLVPEIGLTPQMEQQFSSQFPGIVHTIHSAMTVKQRRLAWQQVYDCRKAQIVIGPRSALFMPVRDLGLVVVDEAHDTGYKQDQLPYYDAVRVAAKLAQISQARCVYGTATPRVADYWLLAKHQTPIVRLTDAVHTTVQTPEHLVIDASNREAFQRSSVFSEEVLDAIGKNLVSGQQTLVFLNRRGTARFVSCQDCGWHAACPTCDTPLTYHGDSHELRCHTCGLIEVVPTSCPNCRSSEIRFQRRGTKALETELSKYFPQARITRFDSDNSKPERLQNRFEAVAAGEIDIIIGTQVISKGLDLAHLSLVCIPQADLSTHLPDFTADEQTFQLLRQVVGRVGRTARSSQVIIQTYSPNSPLLQAVLDNNWQSFYESELIHRKNFSFPPFCYLLQLTINRKTITGAQKAANTCADQIRSKQPSVTILGPAPRFHEKVNGEYQWQIVVKATSRSTLLAIIDDLPAGWRYNIDPSDLL